MVILFMELREKEQVVFCTIVGRCPMKSNLTVSALQAA